MIAGDFQRIRGRLELVGHRYLEPSAAPLPIPPLPSMLARNLPLLKSVEEQMKPGPQHFAALLDSVMAAEHSYLEVERLAVLAETPFANKIPQTHREEIQSALRALDRGFDAKTEDLSEDRSDRQESLEWLSDFRLAIQRLTEGSTQNLSFNGEFTPSELSNLYGFICGLEEIGRLLEPRPRNLASPDAEPAEGESASGPRAFFDPVAFRFSVKLGAAVTLGPLVGLTSQRSDLQTILWSVIVSGQPNQYGAVVRKTMLRLSGCILGGLAALAAMILVSQNFDSLPAYLLAIFLVTMVSTYIAQSDEWLGYAGIQAGITFLICYVSLGPTSDVYRPLWRFWGVVLGSPDFWFRLSNLMAGICR